MNRVTFMLLFFWLIALTVQSQNISHDHSFICATQIDGNSNNPLNSNNPGAISSNGQDLTPRGTQRVLVVFAGFEGGGFDGAIPQQPGDPDLIELDGWINRFSDDYQLPEYVKVADDGRITTTPLFFNDVADWNDPAIMSDPENRRSASNSLFEMSRPNGDDFRLIGDVFSDETGTPVLVTIPRDGGYTRWRDANRALLDEMVALNDDPDYYAQFDTRENKPDFNFDNSVNPVPDGVIDFMIIIWRHSTDGDWEGNQPVDNMEDWFGTGGGYWSGNGNFGSTPPITQTIGGINFGFKEGFVQTKGAGLDVSLFLHEFAHATHRCPHTSGTNNVVGNYFYGAATGNGSTSYPGIFENVQTGWERWFRGHITPIEPTTNGTFVLDDFIESGDALRIEIPFSGGQHLWVEHHTDDNPLYNHRWANSVIPFFGPGVNGNLDFTVPNTDKGIYAYVENITDNMKVTNTFVIGANGLKFLNASGHHDFMPDPSAAPVTTAWGGREIRNYNKGQENPIGGISPWQKIRYNINDEDEDDVIDINTGSNLGNGNEWDYIEREDDLITNRWMGFNPANSGERSPAFTTGDVLGMDSNPALMNYPIYDRGNSQLEPFFLNGLEVKITSASTGGDAVVDVKFKQTHISKDLRWTGNIILPDITEDDDFDLILDVDKAIDLDLSGTVNRHTLHPTLNDFFNPTTFTISSDSKIKLEESAVIRIKNHSTMIVEGVVTEYV